MFSTESDPRDQSTRPCARRCLLAYFHSLPLTESFAGHSFPTVFRSMCLLLIFTEQFSLNDFQWKIFRTLKLLPSLIHSEAAKFFQFKRLIRLVRFNFWVLCFKLKLLTCDRYYRFDSWPIGSSNESQWAILTENPTEIRKVSHCQLAISNCKHELEIGINN